MNVYRTRLNDLQENIVTLILDLMKQTTALIEEFLSNILGMSIFLWMYPSLVSSMHHLEFALIIGCYLKIRLNNSGFGFITAVEPHSAKFYSLLSILLSTTCNRCWKRLEVFRPRPWFWHYFFVYEILKISSKPSLWLYSFPLFTYTYCVSHAQPILKPVDHHQQSELQVSYYCYIIMTATYLRIYANTSFALWAQIGTVYRPYRILRLFFHRSKMLNLHDLYYNQLMRKNSFKLELSYLAFSHYYE
jgi:hypothetical protein